MKNTRRNFIRNSSLTAAGLFFASSIGAKKKTVRRTSSIACAPSESFLPATTISSVQSGKWSDPATWGGKSPGASDVPLIAAGHTVTYDTSQSSISGLTVSGGATLVFNAGQSATLQSTGNVVVQGKWQMHPSSSSVIQTLRFINVNETKFVGGGMDVLDTDTGLWVMGAGQLDLLGTAKTSWTNATGAIAQGAASVTVHDAAGWLAGDEISIAPTEPPTVGDPFVGGFDLRTLKSASGTTLALSSGVTRPHPEVNGKWTAEVMNLTRNVRIEGTSAGRAHIFIRSTSVQSVKYTAIRYMGPRKDRNGDGIAELVTGRYGLHFHHCDDSSRGSLVTGNVVRDTGNHSYVPHVSNGITLQDNIAYNTLEIAFWWDPGDLTHNTLYDHNIVAICGFVPGSLNMNAEDAPTFSSSGFLMTTGDDNICRNNVVVGGSLGDPADGGAYNWEATLNEGVWKFNDNIAHNNDCGLRTWQNSTKGHLIENFTTYYNGLGIFHGAYANNYRYNGGTIYGNTVEIKAASVDTNRVRLENLAVDGAGIVDYCIRVVDSPLDGVVPVFLRNLNIKGFRKAAISDEASQFLKSIDVIGCTIAGTPFYFDPNASSNEVIRVQPVSGQPQKLTKAGTSSIPAFAPTIWGNGNGLQGQYFNSTDFTKPAFTRIDPNVSFNEWSSGVHHLITSNTYSVRWTGQVQAQSSEVYTFSLGSGGGHRLWVNDELILDSWVEHYPGLFAAKPITLVGGQLYDIKLEYFNTDDKTGMGLIWATNSIPQEYIPHSQLYTGNVTTTPPPAAPTTNQSPVAHAGADITITLPTNSATLNGTASADPDGTITAYKWSYVSGPTAGTASSATAATVSLSDLVAGVYVFRLQVTDNKGATATDDVTVTVNAANTNAKDAASTSLTVVAGPNPSSGAFNVTITSNSTLAATLRIYDSSGNLMLQKPGISIGSTVSVGSNLKPGTYYALVSQGTQQKSLMLVKISS